MTERADYLKYLVCDYFATGEGRTVSILVTGLNPSDDEWKTAPTWNEGYVPGVLAVPEEDILKRQFTDVFGSWLAIGMEILDREAFEETYAQYLPPLFLKMNAADQPPNLALQTQLHFNFS
jgi:hypothetical protein